MLKSNRIERSSALLIPPACEARVPLGAVGIRLELIYFFATGSIRFGSIIPCDCKFGLDWKNGLAFRNDTTCWSGPPSARECEKSPASSAGVNVVVVLVVAATCRVPWSQKNQKNLSLPSITLGIRTGPPSAKPN